MMNEGNILGPHGDKVAHFGMYFILQYLFCLSIHGSRFRQKLLLTFLVTATYGIIMEVIQHVFLESRFFEIPDIIANITGALSGILLFHFLKT